jgi:hypothetical protein
MTIRTILIVIIFGLLAWLLYECFNQLDFAVTKNDAALNVEKMKVDDFQNIDAVKTYAKLKLDVIRQHTIRNSEIAINQIWIIIGLFMLNLLLLANNLKRKSA